VETCCQTEVSALWLSNQQTDSTKEIHNRYHTLGSRSQY